MLQRWKNRQGTILPGLLVLPILHPNDSFKVHKEGLETLDSIQSIAQTALGSSLLTGLKLLIPDNDKCRRRLV